tara:strand:+ start:1121 stop:1303 length:183 start_codon:yes stop_codon:yes gene_type:complete
MDKLTSLIHAVNALQPTDDFDREQLTEAMTIVLNEAESSALGDNNQEVLESVEFIKDYID